MGQLGALPSRRVARLVGWVTVTLLVSGLVAWVVMGADEPPDPRLEQGSRVAGFGQVAFRIRPGPGTGVTSAQYCALLAESPDQVARGLMNRRDLAGYDAMVFRFRDDSTSPFYMRNVPMALSVAWFDAAGRFVSSADMAPCGNREDCPLYSPARPYRFALEVPRGGLSRLGVGPGAVLDVGGSCPA